MACKDCFSPYPSVVMLIATLTCVGETLSVILICISVTAKIEHIFIYLLVTCVFSFESCGCDGPFTGWRPAFEVWLLDFIIHARESSPVICIIGNVFSFCKVSLYPELYAALCRSFNIMRSYLSNLAIPSSATRTLFMEDFLFFRQWIFSILSEPSGGAYMSTLLSPLSYSIGLHVYSSVPLPSYFCYYDLTVQSEISYHGFSNFAYFAQDSFGYCINFFSPYWYSPFTICIIILISLSIN